MRRLFILPLLLTLALGLPSCGPTQRAFEAAASVEVSPTAVIVAANAFNALKATATNYIRLPRCTGTNGPICRDQAVANVIIPAVYSGTIARNELVGFYRQHPGRLGPQGLYDALVSSNRTLERVFAQYNIGGR